MWEWVYEIPACVCVDSVSSGAEEISAKKKQSRGLWAKRPCLDIISSSDIISTLRSIVSTSRVRYQQLCRQITCHIISLIVASTLHNYPLSFCLSSCRSFSSIFWEGTRMCHICSSTAVVCDRLTVLGWREKDELRQGERDRGAKVGYRCRY